MQYVYSTMTCDTNYRVWMPSGNDLPTASHSIVIKGGAGMASKELVTSYGSVTKVSDEDLALLEADEAFQRHIERGFIRVERAKIDPEKIAADMTSRDGSSPLVPQDFPQKKQPKTKGE
ncbi:hypothetical protein [Mycoavidus sp. SF9855]|uniref:hypothetical protein n=1 Tax=Mycoavidus sp. SF9855 TaxID=2968475 RepID=UPI00211C7EA7|nr:hypothetical protein [Mycoavidus sp. SF9855]UUM20936.1 hypothetical protein NQD60_05490 [Mycoavidus sp. SF9855]